MTVSAHLVLSGIWLAIAANVPSGTAAQDVLGAPRGRLVEEMRIDGESESLIAPLWVVVGRSGQIAVSQPRDRLVVMYSATGRKAGTFGGPGQGPGEFASPLFTVLAGWKGDTLWLHDTQSRKLMLVAPDLKLAREIVLQTLQGAAGTAFPVVTAPHVKAVHAGDTVTVLKSFTPANRTVRFDTSGKYLFKVSSAGAIVGAVAHLPTDSSRWYVHLGSRTSSGVLPYAIVGIDTLSADGERVLSIRTTTRGANANTFSVRVLDRNGVRLFERRFPFHAVPTSRAAIEAAYTRLLADRPPAEASAIRASFTYPPVEDPIAGGFIGMDHSIWIKLRQVRPGMHTWLVLDAAGEPQVHFEIPATIQVNEASLTHLWGTVKDAYGVPSIVRYRVDR